MSIKTAYTVNRMNKNIESEIDHVWVFSWWMVIPYVIGGGDQVSFPFGEPKNRGREESSVFRIQRHCAADYLWSMEHKGFGTIMNVAARTYRYAEEKYTKDLGLDMPNKLN